MARELSLGFFFFLNKHYLISNSRSSWEISFPRSIVEELEAQRTQEPTQGLKGRSQEDAEASLIPYKAQPEP